jgi:hypothetical protein
MAWFKVYPDICLEGLRKTTTNFRIASLYAEIWARNLRSREVSEDILLEGYKYFTQNSLAKIQIGYFSNIKPKPQEEDVSNYCYGIHPPSSRNYTVIMFDLRQIILKIYLSNSFLGRKMCTKYVIWVSLTIFVNICVNVNLNGLFFFQSGMQWICLSFWG